MALFPQENYKDLREIIKGRKYEEIYRALQNEVTNIKKTGVSLTNTEKLRSYIESETRELIFAERGLPTYFVKIIILLGPEFENDIVKRLKSFMTTNYSTEFQTLITKNFEKINQINLFYKHLDGIIKNFENKFFNLPIEWCVLQEIIRTLYLLMKQKLCDIFYFTKFPESDYIEAFTVILSEEKKFLKYITQQSQTDDKEELNKIDFYSLNDDPYTFMIFKLFMPYFEIYLKSHFTEFKSPDFDVKMNELMIMSIFLTIFRSFEKLYKKIVVFQNQEAVSSLLGFLYSNLSTMINKCNTQISNQIDLIYQSEDLDFNLNKKGVLERIIIVLNTSAYVYDYISDFSSALTKNSNFDKQSSVLYNSLGDLEKSFSDYLAKYIYTIFKHIEFDKVGFSKYVICSLENYIFGLPIEELSSEVRNLMIESIVIHILSSLYILDFNVDKAEVYLCEVAEIKAFLTKFNKNIPLFGLLESYIKIFLCPVEDKSKFVDNFMLFSNGIFSFNQIVNSLTLTETNEDLKEEYSRRMTGLNNPITPSQECQDENEDDKELEEEINLLEDFT